MVQLLSQPSLRYQIPSHFIVGPVEYVPWGHVYDLILRDSNTVGQLLAPPSLIHLWRVVSILTGVHVNPSLLLVDEDLSPHVVSPIMDEASIVPKSNAHASEAIGPLPAPARACLTKFDDLVVAGEPGHGSAHLALVELSAGGLSLLLFVCGLCSTKTFQLVTLSPTEVTVRLICPREELLFVPLEELFELGNLV